MRSHMLTFALIGLVGSSFACNNKGADKKPADPAAKADPKAAPGPEAKAGDLPAAVAAGVKKAYPNAKVAKFKKESTGYEVSLREDGKPDWYADFTAAGELDAVGTPVKLSEVPENVMKAMKAKYPAGKFDDEAFVEKSPDGKTVKKYKLVVRNGDKRLGAEINGDGTGEIDEEPAD